PAAAAATPFSPRSTAPSSTTWCAAASWPASTRAPSPALAHPRVFVDETTIEVTAGRGGDGVTSFHREKYKPRGGPDGGDGGRGGDVVLVADPGVGTLVEYHFHPHQRAGRGAHGQGNNRKGADGEGRTLPVPVGTPARATD